MKRALIATAVLLLATASSSAASDAQADQEKRDAFSKFIVLAGVENQYNKMIEIFLASFKQGFESGLHDSIAEMDSENEEMVNKAEAIANEVVIGFVAKFKDGLASIAPFSELVDQVYYPVFGPQFTTAELNDIVHFYESPVGQKFSSLAPELMQQSAALFNEKYGPRVQEFSMSLAKEQWDAATKRLEELKKR